MCSICTHPQRHLIELALHLDVKSPRRVAGDFGLELLDVLEHSGHVVWPRRPLERCLPMMHDPYGDTPPGALRTCRHCGAALPQEEKDLYCFVRARLP